MISLRIKNLAVSDLDAVLLKVIHSTTEAEHVQINARRLYLAKGEDGMKRNGYFSY